MSASATTLAARVAAIPAVHFNQALLAIDAARQGQGLVMTSRLLTHEETAAGTPPDVAEDAAARLAQST